MQNRWSKLKYEIEKVYEDENRKKGTEKSDKILEIVKEVFF